MSGGSTEFATVFVIHIQQFDGASTDRFQTDDLILFDGEMLVPFLLARMKQWDELPVYLCGDIRALVKIAPMTREAAI